MNRSGILLGVFMLVSLSMWSQGLQVYSGDKLPGRLEDAVRKFLVGGGVEILSISYQGDSRALGFFTDPKATTGFNQGMVLSTGAVDSIAQPNRSDNLSTSTSGLRYSAEGLEALVKTLDTTAQLLFDVAKLTIRFRPATNRISFRYFFASEEYPQFTCSSFNDVFGFFLSGPRPEGGTYLLQNLAVVPGTETIVSVNTIHQGNPIKPDCIPVHPQYYHDNADGQIFAFNAYLDAFTASAAVVPCAEYQMELALADLADDHFDTGVFIEANSFQSKPYRITEGSLPEPLILQEGCNPIQIQLDWLDTLIPVHYSVLGTRGNNDDLYVRETVRQDPAGSSILFQLVPLPDKLDEGAEEIYLILSYGSCGADTVRLTVLDGFESLKDLPEDTTVCQGTALGFLGNQNSTLRYNFRGSRGAVVPGRNDFSLEIPYFPAPYFDIQWLQSFCLAVDANTNANWDLFLTSPGGVRIPLMESGQGPRGWTSVCFNWDSTTLWQNATPPFIGTYRPDVLPFINLPYSGPVTGTWYLTIYNHSLEEGQLRDWNLSLNDPIQETWEWTRDNSSPCINCPILFTNPDTSANYTLIRSTTLRCQDIRQMHVEVLPNKLESTAIQCVTTGDSLTFLWNNEVGVNYEVSTNGLDWFPPNRPPFRQVYGTLPAPPDTFYLKVDGLCLDSIFTYNCSAVPCITGPQISPPRDTSVACFGQRIEEYQVQQLPGYTYWLQGTENHTGHFSDLAAGTFPLVVTDENGCKTAYTLHISEPDLLHVDARIIQEVTCPYANDGHVELQVTGGNLPYAFAWSNGNDEPNPVDLPFGPNQVIVTDQKGCVAYKTVELSVPQDLELSIEQQEIHCAGLKTGQIRVNVSGASGPFRFDWAHNPFLDNPVASNLAAGTYRVTVTDQSGCQVSAMTVISEPEKLDVGWESEAISCPDANGGVLRVTVSGGIAPYIYQWNNGWEADELTEVQPGNYCVTVTDGEGCQAVACQVVSPGRNALLEEKIIQPSCLLGPLGSIDMQLDAAFAPYSIIWTGGSKYMSNGYGIKLAEPGKYTAFVHDSRGCNFSRTFEIVPLDTLRFSITASDVTCAGYQDGLFMVQVQQSNGSVFFSLDSLQWQTNGLFRDLSEGMYRLFVRDQADCTAQDTVLVLSPDSLSIDLGRDTVIRYGQTILINPVIENAQGDPTLVWTGSEVPADCMNCPELLLQPEYSTSIKVMVLDGKGCRAEDFLEVSVEDEILIEVPTAFTPNGDGLNDHFVIHGTPPIHLLEVMVWDRLGNLIYDSDTDQLNDRTTGWDGTFRGKAVPAGVYRWLVRAETRPGKQESTSGWIQLLR